MVRPGSAGRAGAFGLALALSAVLAVGCSDQGRLRSNVVVESIHGNQAIQSDVYNLGNDINDSRDDFVPVDTVSVVFRNTPLDPALTPEPNGPFGDVVITNYRVDYNVPGVDLAPFVSTMYVKVPTGETGKAIVIALPTSYKMQPPLVDLISGGGAGEYSGTMNFTFWGKELLTDDPFVLHVSLGCSFADFSDK
jgi:hypothetical protein